MAPILTTGAGLFPPISTGGRVVTNLVVKSSDPTHFSWALTGTALTTGQTDPLGGSGAYKLTEDSSNGQHQNNQGASINVTSGVGYIMSVYAARGPSNNRDMRLLTISPDVCWITINLATGATIDSNAAGNITAAPVASGFYRISFTLTPTATGFFSYLLRMYSAGAGGTAYTGDGASNVLLFGPQMEVAGGFTTPGLYAPT